MPAFVIEGRHTIYVAAWKKHVGFYAVNKAPSTLEQDSRNTAATRTR